MSDSISGSTTGPAAESLIRDPLTGAYSRALFDRRLAEEIDRVRRYGAGCVLAMLDIDHFKSINDAYGHPRGDQILCEFVRRVHANLRVSDMLFRYGGDEFVLLLPQTTKKQAIALCDRLIEKVRSAVFDGEPPLSLSFSMGLGAFPEDAADPTELVNAADRRSYLAKRRGRNRLVAVDGRAEQRLYFDPTGRLVERDAPLDTLQRFFQSLNGHPCGVLAITGEAGAGRSRFLAQAAQMAQMQSAAVLSLCGTRALRHRPYGALMSARWPLALPVIGGATAVDEALRQGLIPLGKERLLIAVDDWSLLDRATRELVQRLLNISSIPALALAYTRLPDAPPVTMPAVMLTAEVMLEPFSRNGLKVWLREILQGEPEAAFCEWLIEQTGAYPGRLQKLLTALAGQGLVHAQAAGHWEVSPHYFDYQVAPEQEQTAPPNNLPASVTDFVGRHQLCWELDQLLATRRLLTLVGPGGIGKTRLALELATARQDLYADGVWFIALEAARTPDLVISAVAQAFEIKPVGEQSLFQNVKTYLRDRMLLLVLDNFEQVLDAASVVEEILVTAPQVQIVVTSRERLHLSGEQVYNVPPLHLPDLENLPSLGTLERQEAIALFVDRAKQAHYDFALTEANARVVAEICVGLEGLPLAIELAAARTDQFSPPQLATQLQSRLTALVDGPRSLTARQRTLRDTVQWSYSLLTPAEQVVFARLGVFRGGCTPQSAEQICCAESAPGSGGFEGDLSPLSQAAFQAGLTALTNKSLLSLREGKNGEPRFTMLETLREYAVEQLELTGEAEQLRRRHALRFLALLEDTQELVGDALERLERERDNLYVALDWLCRRNEVELALRFTSLVWKFWHIRAHYYTEGQRWLERVLALGGVGAKSIAPSFRARVLWGAGRMAETVSDLAGSEARFSESAALAEKIGDEATLALARHGLADVIMRRMGDLSRAEALYLKSLEDFRRLNWHAEIGWPLMRLGNLYWARGRYRESIDYYQQSLLACRSADQKRAIGVLATDMAGLLLLQGRYEQATALLEEAFANIEGIGDLTNIVRLRRHRGQLMFQTGDYARARVLLEECVRMSRSISDELCVERSLSSLGATLLALGNAEQAKVALEAAVPIARRLFDNRNIAWTHILLGHTALMLNRPEQAGPAYRESFELYRDKSLPLDHVPECLEGIAWLVIARAQPESARRAARFLGAADAVRRDHELPRPPFMQTTYERLRAIALTKLDEATYAEAHAEGEALTVEQITAEAMAQTL